MTETGLTSCTSIRYGWCFESGGLEEGEEEERGRPEARRDFCACCIAEALVLATCLPAIFAMSAAGEELFVRRSSVPLCAAVQLAAPLGALSERAAQNRTCFLYFHELALYSARPLLPLWPSCTSMMIR